jgi:hypothetical protein
MTIMTRPVTKEYEEGWEATYRYRTERDTTLDIAVRPTASIGTAPIWGNPLPSHYRDDDEDIFTPTVFHA